MKRTTRTPILDTWQSIPVPAVMRSLLHHTTAAFERQVHDGYLHVLVAHEPKGWHLSISHEGRFGRLGRYPTWDDIADARYKFLPDEVTMAMLLPPRSQYVNLHDTTFHLHEIPTEGIDE